jgi:predicted TIM-barrel fold metal-dependent hydrolase
MIDTHQHLMLPARFGYGWTGGFPALQHRFGLEEYRQVAPAEIRGTIFMEVDVDEGQSAGEAGFFCELAEDPSNKLLGVIASARPESDGFEAYLDSIAHPRLVGIRRILHTQPDELSQSPIFRENLRALGRRGLPFDLCVLQRQHPLALELVRACPGTTFVLDHCGVPDIAGNDAPRGDGFLTWRKGIRALAAEPNLCCKISGITAYAGEHQRTPEGLRPYTDTVIEAFGPARCLWGGDWPVVNLGSGLARWCELARELIVSAAGTDAEAVLAGNAASIYQTGEIDSPKTSHHCDT